MDIKEQIIEKFKKNFENFNAIHSVADNIVEYGWQIKRDSTYEYVISLLFSKAFKTYKSINILCKEGYGQDGGILLRSLLEIYINITWISKKESEKRAKRYYEYIYIGQKKWADIFDKYNLKEEGLKLSGEATQNNKEKIYKLYHKVKNNYKNEQGKIDEFHWSGKSVKKMASECGLEIEYVVMYNIFSEITHSNPLIESAYIQPNIKCLQIAADMDPSEEYVGEVLSTSNFLFVRILGKLNSVFNLGKEKELEEIGIK